MIERKKCFNSSLHNISKKRLAEIRAGTYTPKRQKPIRTISKTMRTRITDWRKTAKDICTIDGQLWCPLCGKMIVDGKYDAHHYMQRRGQAHSIDNDKYVVALHPYCHRNINHNNLDDFYCARDKIIATLKLWGK